MKKIILLVFFGLSVFIIKSQNYSFTQSTYTANGYPTNVLKGDFNNDGKMDLVMQNQNGINCYLQASGNTFSTVVTTYTTSLQIYNCADFNGDGKLDVLADNSHLFLGIGNGSFSLSPTNFGSNASDYAAISLDFNKDGKSDLVSVTSFTGQGLSYFSIQSGLGNGNCNQLPYVSINGEIPSPNSNNRNRIAVDDLNNDSNKDIVVSTLKNGTGYLSIYNGSATGDFSIATTYTYNFDITTVKISDMNMDGNNDIVFSSRNNVYVLQGDGLGGFLSYYNHAILSTSIDIGDVNNDGKMDIINFFGTNTGFFPYSLCVETNTVSIIDNTGLGFSLSANTFSINSFYGPHSPIICDDFNSDGKLDLAVNTYSCTPTLSICYNTTTTPLTLSVSSVSMCVGSCNTLTAVASGGTGPYTYSWIPGWLSGSSIQTCPSSSGIYSVVVTDAMMNSATSSAIATVNSNCQDVWPGDANSNGITEITDVFELAWNFGLTGTPRSSVSNNWQSYFSSNWTGTITNGKNLNHSDCNGDGVINLDDTLAIYNNYDLTHSFKASQPSLVNPQISIIPDQIAVAKGIWGTASIYLGDATTNINNINGVAFTVDFDNNLIESNSIYIEYQNSFIDAGQNLRFRKLKFSNGKIYTATTHTVSGNVSGQGKIATLHYQIKSTLTTDQVLNLGISQAKKSESPRIITPLTSGTATLMAIGASVGLQELSNNLILISPNPTNGSLTIHSKTELQKIEFTSITGQVLLSEVSTNVSHTLHLDNFANGIYFVNVYQNNRIVKREKVVLNK
jgi:hypothetical protein